MVFATTLAYIDPGTGSALVYVVTALVVSAYFAIRALYYRAVELAFRGRHEHQKCSLAIHCEDPRYEITFLPVLRELAAAGVESTFFTMYPRDATFEALPQGVRHHAIAPGVVGYAYLNHLEARMLVTTTPQLDVMTFRRSKKVAHYCHLPHALGESRYVRPYAYDFFDSVLVCGDVLMANIRRIEGIRGLPAKRLFATGIPHWDELLKIARAADPTPRDRQRPVVLVAPSWGPQSIFQAFGTGVVRRLAARYPVIVRPHPQMKVSQPEIYAEVLALEGVTVDTDRTPAGAMARADILVSDISGIMHEFAFLYEKPVIIVDHQRGMRGLEGELLGGDSELKERCREFIVPIPPEAMDGIADRVPEVLARHSVERLRQVRDELVYNVGAASPVAARQIRGILEAL